MRNNLEHIVIDQHDKHAASFQCGIDVDQSGPRTVKFHRQIRCVRLDHAHALSKFARQTGRDITRRTFSEIIDIGFECEAEAADLCARIVLDQCLRLGEDMMHFRVVYFARLPDHLCLFRRTVDDEPRVHRNAMPAHAWTGLKDVDPRMTIGQPDHFPNIQPLCVGNHAQFIGKGNVGVAECVFDQLGHFRTCRIGRYAFAAHEALVECQRLARAARRDAADRAVIADQLFEDFSRQYALRAIGNRNIRAFTQTGHHQIGAQACNQVAHRYCGANWTGRFQNDGVTSLQHTGNFGCRVHHIAGVGRMVAVFCKGGGDRDYEHIGRLHLRAGFQRTALDRAAYQAIQIDFLDMDFTAIDRVYHALCNVDAGHRAATAGNDSCRGQADIAQADDADIRFVFADHDCAVLPAIDFLAVSLGRAE